MAKRKLTRRQEWRIQKIQEERLQRAEKKATATEETASGLGPEQEGYLVANYGVNLMVEDAGGHTLRCVARQHLGPLVCGDRVVFQSTGTHQGVVVALLPRRTVLSRPDFSGNLRPVAANIQQIFVVVAPKPGIHTFLIDRYLVAAETLGITPVILVNKIDLADETQRRDIQASLGVYTRISYRVIYASTKTDHGLDELEAQLAKSTSVLVGQSGVGKSSLIKALLPDIDIRIGALSEATGLGRHTTTTAVLYHLRHSGDLIDSPGVREFGLWQLSPQEVEHGFLEFRRYLGRCKFRNCTHTIEPGCAIRDAVTTGDISPARLAGFHDIVASLNRNA